MFLPGYQQVTRSHLQHSDRHIRKHDRELDHGRCLTSISFEPGMYLKFLIVLHAFALPL